MEKRLHDNIKKRDGRSERIRGANKMTQKLFHISDPERVDRLNMKVIGNGPVTLVFIAGLGGTTRYWEPRVKSLEDKFRIVLVDLLGFGDSPKPWTKYTVNEHVRALDKVLSDLGPAILVGHSLGALLAIAYARRHQQQIEKLILFSLPYFGSEAVAHKYLKEGPVRGGFLFTNVALTMLTCIVTRRILGRVLPHIIRDIPREVVEDLVKHTWRSSTSSLWEVVYRYDAAQDLIVLDSNVRILFIHGSDDIVAPIGPVERLVPTRSNLTLNVLPGLDHHPFLRAPEKCLELIEDFVQQI